MYFSLNLKYLRTTAKMRQEDIAADLGVTREAYRKYEDGTSEPKLKLLPKFSAIYKVTIDQLINEDLMVQRWTPDKSIASIYKTVDIKEIQKEIDTCNKYCEQLKQNNHTLTLLVESQQQQIKLLNDKIQQKKIVDVYTPLPTCIRILYTYIRQT